jgi:trigger factor
VKSSVENLEPTKVKLTVEVPFEEFKPAIDKSAKDIANQVNIPGFRRGHVPARVIEARFGRGAIVEDAVNNSLDEYYAEAVRENDLHPLSRPQVDVTTVPVNNGDTSPLVFDVTVDVRPAIAIPDPAGFTLSVDSVAVSDDDVEERLTALRERFGTLKDVERAAQDRDYVTIDMEAKIGDETVDSVSGVSYRIGDGNMLEGLDEAVTGLEAGGSTTFTSTLAGGDHAGEEAEVSVTVSNVKESELPEADDDFAQLASEFDTIDELRADLREQVGKDKETNQVHAARDLLLEELRKAVEFPLPQSVVEEEISQHLQREGKEPGDEHGEEIREDTERMIRDQLMLDVLAESFNVNVEQNELFNFLVEQSQAYGMDPNQFIQAAASTNELGAFASELARGKALISALRLAKVVDADGKELDVAGVVGEAPENETVPDFAAMAEKVAEQQAKVAADTAKASSEKVDAKAADADDAEKAAKPAAKKSAKKVEKAESKKATAAKASQAKGGEAEPFNPATAKVDEVLAYVADVDDAEKARVLEAEKAGKARKTLIEKLQS